MADSPEMLDAPVSTVTRGKPQMLGKYRIDARLGKGGMGVVYQAEDTILQRPVAIKILPRRLSSDPVMFERFLFEARAVAKLTHPNLVVVHEVNENQGGWYLVMELVSGGSTQDRLRKQGPFPWREAVRIAADACRGLVAAHEAGVIHRDLKPANVLLTPEGVGKLADFGLAKALDAQGPGPTSPETVLGTPAFMSPEQCRAQPLDARTDLYSLGATLYTLLTQKPPFDATSPLDVLYAHCHAPRPDPRSVVPNISAEVVAVIHLAMAIAPAERFATAREMLAVLERLAPRDSGATIPIPEALPVEPAPRKKRVADTPTVFMPREEPPAKKSRPKVKPAPASTARRWLLGGLIAAACTGGGALWLATRPGRQAPPDEPPGTPAVPWWKSLTARGHTFNVDSGVTSVAFSPDQRWLAALTERKGIYVWDTTTGQAVAGLAGGQATDLGRTLLFTRDSATLLLGGGSRLVRIQVAKAQVSEVRLPFPRTSALSVLALAPDSDNVLVTRASNPQATFSEVLLISADGRSKVANIPTAIPGPVVGAAYTPDGRELIVLTADGTVRGYDGRWLGVLRGKEEKLERGTAHALGMTPTDARQNKPPGPYLVVADASGLFFMATTSWATRIPFGTETAPTSVAFSPTSQFWAAGLTSGQIVGRNNVADRLFDLTGHTQAVRAVAFGTQGHLLASGSDDRTVRVWNFAEPAGV